MTNELDENKINPNDWLEPYKPIPACEIKDCNEIVYCGDGILGCRIAEDGLVCDDFNNDDECCMYRQLEYYKEALKRKEQECEKLLEFNNSLVEEHKTIGNDLYKEIKDYRKKLKAKEQECEELNKLVKKQKDVLIHKTILADEYEKAYSFENLKVAKLKYCLAEIKEIATCPRKIETTFNINNWIEIRNNILQKISEVENDR